MSALFDELEEQMRKATLVRFGDLALVPSAPCVYTAWRHGDSQCFYVGMAVTALRSRISSHFSGQRGGDQFCLYVYDSFVHQERCALTDTPTTRAVNTLTGQWIRDYVSFRCIELEMERIRAVETHLRRSWRPTLNTLQRIA